MWIIVLYSKEKIKLFEFEKELEARETMDSLNGKGILTQII